MFAKVFTQIFDSSIAENWQARLVFTDLLTLADINGVVDMTHDAISRRTNVPLEIVRAAIAELEKPDPRSRNPDHEGRRIVRLDNHRDWGWFITNYQHYRVIASEEQRRQKTAERTRRWRAKASGNTDVTHSDAIVTHRNAAKPSVTRSDGCDVMQRDMDKYKEIRERECAGALIIPASERLDGIALSLDEVISYGAGHGIPEENCRQWFEHVKAFKTVQWKSGLLRAYRRAEQGRSAVFKSSQ